MSFPATRAAMIEAGYSLNEYTRCRGCKRLIEFWNTPAGKHMPMNPMEQDDSPAVSHFITCPVAALFRKKGPKRCAAPTKKSSTS